MAGTIYSGTYSTGIILNNANSTIASTAVVKGTNANAVYGASGTTWNLSNYGLVQATGTAGAGVQLLGTGIVLNDGTVSSAGGNGIYLGNGGSVTNGATNNATASITTGANTSTVFEGILANGAPATVTNFGSIGAPGSNDNAIYLEKGGQVTNQAGGTIAGGSRAILISGSVGTVVNLGSINDTGSINGAVAINVGGSFTNGSTTDTTAIISAARTTVSFKNVAGTVTNFATIISNAAGTGGGGVYMAGGGTFTNQATGVVKSTRNGFSSALTAATVINSGYIANIATPTTGGSGIYLGAGGAVTNNSTGTITSVSSAAFSAKNTAATLVNYGLVENTANSGAVYLGAGGTITNGSASNATATLKAGNAGAVVFKGTVAAATDIVNFGSITGGATVAQGIYGSTTGGGTITNQLGGQISGYGNALSFKAGAETVVNYGTVFNTSTSHAAVYFGGGGSFTNGSASDTSALVTGGNGINVKNAAATVTNFGTIKPTGTSGSAIYFGSGGTLTNNAGALIFDVNNAVSVHGATINNLGTIASTGTTLSTALYMGGGGSLTNAAGGQITAKLNAVLISGTTGAAATTLTNSGLISGAIGVFVNAADPAPTTIINYGTIAGTSGTAIQLGGNTSTVVIEKNSTLNGSINGFVVGDTLDFAGVSATSAALSNGVLNLSSGTNIVASVGLSGTTINGAILNVSSDLAGGTDVQLASPLTIPQDELSSSGLAGAVMTNSNGVVVLDEMAGATMGFTQIGVVGPEWRSEGEGALLGDGRNQVLLWNSSTGAIVTGEDDGGTAVFKQISAVGPEWQFEGVGPLAGAGNANFLLENSTTGAVVVGTVSGGNTDSPTTAYTVIGGLGPEWSFEGVGQFLNNGSTDFLLWDTNSASGSYGQVVAGQDTGGSTSYTVLGGLGPEWQFEGSGDLLNDGKTSFLLHDSSSGGVVVAEWNGSSLSFTQVAAVGSEWQFLGVGDYDGKSQAEFLMFNQGGANPNGTLELGTISGGTAAFTAVGGVDPTQWTFRPTSPALLP